MQRLECAADPDSGPDAGEIMRSIVPRENLTQLLLERRGRGGRGGKKRTPCEIKGLKRIYARKLSVSRTVCRLARLECIYVYSGHTLTAVCMKP